MSRTGDGLYEPVQELPPTGPNDKPHILDASCWCNPIERTAPWRLIHRTTRMTEPSPDLDRLRAAEDDYAEEAAQFYGKYEAGFKAGARWALNRWRDALASRTPDLEAAARLFVLRRTNDVSGVSGLGDVAEGVVFSDGVTVLRWNRAGGSTAVYDSLERMEAIHGHDGGTQVVWDRAALSSEEAVSPAPHYVNPDTGRGFATGGNIPSRAEEAVSPALDRPEIVCLCGSTRFYDEFQQANYDLTMAGRIVLSVGFYPHAKAAHGHGEGVGHDSAEKVALDELHKRKIDLADRVYVLNVGGYIGSSTRSEIDYALAHGKPVTYAFDRDGVGSPIDGWPDPDHDATNAKVRERLSAVSPETPT